VTILNNLTVPVTIFLDYGDFDRRIGIVAPKSSGSLPLPASALEELTTLQLYAKVEKGFPLETHGFKVTPDMRVGWVVGKDIPSKPAGDTIKVAVPKPAFASTVLNVTNDRDVMTTLYAEDNGVFSVKLGYVAPHASAKLSVPQYLLSGQTLRVVAHPEGGSDLEPQEIQLAGPEVSYAIPATAE
jgi:hypothetical protein